MPRTKAKNYLVQQATDLKCDSGGLIKPPREQDDRKATERTCAVKREVLPVHDLLRFVRQRDGTLLVDLRCRLPGRGVWISAERAIVAKAVKTNVFRRQFRTNVTVPADLENEVDALLLKAALGMLSLCNKAGKVVTGFAKVETAIEQGKAATVLQASDGAPDGLRKIKAAVWRTQQKELPFLSVFTIAQMSMALGRENVVHAALLKDTVSSVAQSRMNKLVKYRAEVGLSDEAGQTAGTDTE